MEELRETADEFDEPGPWFYPALLLGLAGTVATFTAGVYWLLFWIVGR